ncbi:uncharacterized protein CC84DRAFT_1123023 [Paraphaeosphaeria sporulosa]|uniref:C2H2-type domain-containing protein n=1 Tax=Paraphaeosphaeria sporulosa TaxID=1460663 RepID=A0A177C9X0_9PLEO|nr:uncharacterized protein CC84DRAFT_1123023 [Paraphaeosphaeria sporulosa]OAG03629.1 hypothetical protein CC84DRAFT_1123023 [Paraphaeosphaeria sporulosa]
MLSTNAPSGIQRRRTLHRRQNSTPAAFEAPRLHQLPTNIQQRRTQRTGMSLDLRGLNLEAMTRPGTAATIPEYATPDGTVSNTNLGQQPQHTMQVAHSHSQHQPGPQQPFLRSPVQSLPSPRTPHRTLRPQSPPRPSHSPSRAPNSPTKAIVDQRIKDLQEDVLAVYGPNANLFITLPTPNATPQKPAQIAPQEQLQPAALAPSFSDLADIKFSPSSNAMAFNFENLDYDMGYESSSYYTSDALSPSPISSPNQKSMQAFLENIPEFPTQEQMAELTPHSSAFSQAPMFSPSSASMSMNGIPSTALSQSALLPELEIDASLEYTGISPEEVQRYISEQDQTTNKWTCLYPECGKVFGRRENIRSHVQTHLGDRQYKCNGCGKKFVRQHDLKRHAKIHTGNKPYKCPCGAGFARQDALTRHRQRGMCVGGFENVVRKNVKRGRPKKHRPELDERIDKANKTRRALASASSSVSGGSPMSDPRSSPPPFENDLRAQTSSTMLHESVSYHEQMSSNSDHYTYESDAKPYIEHSTSSFASNSSYADDATSMALLQHFSQPTHTPPMSPANQRPNSSGSASSGKAPIHSSPLKVASTPSQSSTQSNPFTTPPTSPAEPKDEIDELFELPDNSYSQFELELQAMGTLDGSCDFLDFTV